MNDRIITATWSEIMSMKQALKHPYAKLPGVYMWLIGKPHNERIIYVGTSNPMELQLSDYYRAFNGLKNRDHWSFDLEQIRGQDIYLHMCNGELQMAYNKGLFFPGGDHRVNPMLDTIRKEFAQNLKFSLARIEDDGPAIPSDTLIKDAEFMLIKYLRRKFKIDDYRTGNGAAGSILGRTYADANPRVEPIKRTVLQNNFPSESEAWSTRLEQEIKGVKCCQQEYHAKVLQL
jgi:hypothetical protein